MTKITSCCWILVFSSITLTSKCHTSPKTEKDQRMENKLNRKLKQFDYVLNQIPDENVKQQLKTQISGVILDLFSRENEIEKLGVKLGNINGSLWFKIVDLTEDLVANEIMLGFRGRIERLEQLIFPLWLFGTQLPRWLRWFLVLELEISPRAAALKCKLNRHNITSLDFGRAMNYFFKNLSDGIHTYKYNKIPKTSKEWEKVYSVAQAREDYEKVSLKIAILPLPDAPTEVTNPEKPLNTFKHFIVLVNVHQKATEEDIQKILTNMDPNSESKIILALHDDGKFHGSVAILFTSKLTKFSKCMEVYKALKALTVRGNHFHVYVYDFYDGKHNFEDQAPIEADKTGIIKDGDSNSGSSENGDNGDSNSGSSESGKNLKRQSTTAVNGQQNVGGSPPASPGHPVSAEIQSTTGTSAVKER